MGRHAGWNDGRRIVSRNAEIVRLIVLHTVSTAVRVHRLQRARGSTRASTFRADKGVGSVGRDELLDEIATAAETGSIHESGNYSNGVGDFGEARVAPNRTGFRFILKGGKPSEGIGYLRDEIHVAVLVT